MSLTRNPDLVQIFADAAIFVGKTLTPTIPATIATEFDATWDNLGILNGDDGVKNPREWDVTEHFGWGIGLYRKGYKNYKESRVFTCLEENQTTRRIAYPGSSATNIVVPRPGYFPLAFEFINDLGVPERLFTARPAQCWIPNLDRNESDPTGKEVTADIFATGSGLLYTRQYTPINETQTVTVENATGGTFTLSLDGVTFTTAIAFDAAASAVQTALQALLGTGNVTVTGTAGDYTVVLAGIYAGQANPLLTANGSSLVGTGAAVNVEAAA
ncbi:hypothetical protein BJY24_004147 [Nocardia transvalensis]|uniref:Uncharacterized protein n=1 Tax=Nocardia transvalensis TaxID=37333 RepID=A0A7W9PG46_9NOCA|nr:hypothetical protein [Nocardia transvalensis]MBB5915280.1 hypothetical protein [Nocardia transvalensis]